MQAQSLNMPPPLSLTAKEIRTKGSEAKLDSSVNAPTTGRESQAVGGVAVGITSYNLALQPNAAPGANDGDN